MSDRGHRTGTWRNMGSCAHCGADPRRRCRTPSNKPCHPHAGRLQIPTDNINARTKVNQYCGIPDCPGGPCHAHDPNDWSADTSKERP